MKAHIQKKCKSEGSPKLVQKTVHKKNDNILTEDEHKCPQCSKITNNQVSLVNHINTVHVAPKEKCDTCGIKFLNREDLVLHLVESHTEQGIQQTQEVRQQPRRQQQGGLQDGLQGRLHGGMQGGLQEGPQGRLQGRQQGGLQGQRGRHQQGYSQWLQKLRFQHCAYETTAQHELEFHNESLHQHVNARQWCHRCNIEVNLENTGDKHK